MVALAAALEAAGWAGGKVVLVEEVEERVGEERVAAAAEVRVAERKEEALSVAETAVAAKAAVTRVREEPASRVGLLRQRFQSCHSSTRWRERRAAAHLR